MRIHNWFSDGHPQKYHVAALFLTVVALGSAVTTTILAEDVEMVATACVYSYSDWGSCQPNEKRMRTVTGYSPVGCIHAAQPSLMESCAYAEPAVPRCAYTYSNWGTCQRDGRQVRSVVSRSPSDCQEDARPILEQSCAYVANDVRQPCVYSYSDWGSCQPNEKRMRTVTGYSPVGCEQVAMPYTVESCSYNVEENTPERVNATQCVYTYSSWGACQPNGKRTRPLVSRYPSDCVEYTQPALEQSCIYDSVAVLPAVVVSEVEQEVSKREVQSIDMLTPVFSFVNVTDDMILRGNFEIRGAVRGADSVEYYLMPIGSNTHKYIGKGSRVSDTDWTLTFSSKEFPNGEFYLRAKVKNMYGEYGSSQRKIRIANQDRAAIGSVSLDDGFVPFEMNKAEKMAILEKIVDEFQVPKDETVDASLANDPDWKRKQIFDYCQAQSEKCFPERDSDSDGLNDIDEIRYGTNPHTADSDLDGFVDGDEVKNGFDPAKYSPGDRSDRIVFESPKTHGEVKQNYVIQNVSVNPSENGRQKLHLEGKGLPNSFVTIYIYSDPIVLTVKTDGEGNWMYELDKDLEDGHHEAYVAVTDNTGKITAKSEPIAFVKTAQAITVIPEVDAATVADTLPVTQSHAKRDLLLLVSLITAAVAVGLSTIGFIKHKRTADVSGETTL